MGDLDDFHYNSPIRVVPTGIVEGVPVLSEVFYFAGTSLYQFVNYLPLTPNAEVPENETFMIFRIRSSNASRRGHEDD
jgi:hypothetical protein